MKPMDFSVWSILEAKIFRKIHCNVDDFKWFLLQACQEIPPEQLRASAESVRRRLETVIKCEGGHFE